MLQPDAEHLPVEQGEHHRQQHKADEVADEHAAPDGHARLAQHAVKQADEAPAGRAQNDVQIGDGLFHGSFLVSGESWHSSDQIRPALREQRFSEGKSTSAPRTGGSSRRSPTTAMLMTLIARQHALSVGADIAGKRVVHGVAHYKVDTGSGRDLPLRALLL